MLSLWWKAKRAKHAHSSPLLEQIADFEQTGCLTQKGGDKGVSDQWSKALSGASFSHFRQV